MLKRTTPGVEVTFNPALLQPVPVRKISERSLKRAARLRKEIDSLRRELSRLLDGAC